MKKCQLLKSNQHEKNDRINRYSIPKIRKKQPNKLTTYETLLNEFVKSNPDVLERDLLEHCVRIAKACGLHLIGGHHVD